MVFLSLPSRPFRNSPAVDGAPAPLPFSFCPFLLIAHSLVTVERNLAGATILLTRVDCSYRKISEAILDQEEVRSYNRLDFSGVEVMKRCVMEGVGISVLPESAVEEETACGRLVVLPWAEGAIEVAVLMIRHRDRWISPSLKAFMETTREVMARPR